MKVTIIAGARPNFMKIAPLVAAISAAEKQGNDLHYRLVYVGPQDDKSIEPSLFTDLNMPRPDVCLNVDGTDFFKRMAGILVTFAEELKANPTDMVIVVDDMTPTMACSLVAKKMGLKVAHVAAGTRSFDMDMPKELNRMITDGLSDYLFTAGMMANRNLNQTGTEQEQVYFVGNLLMDTLRQNHNRFVRPACLAECNVRDGEYLLLTLNRRALLDDEESIRRIMQTLLEKVNYMPVVVPVHAYVQQRLTELGITAPNLHLLPPQPYLQFGYMESHARCIVTDSGNVAEEATFFGIPCITLSNYAEHPETVTVGTNRLVGTDTEELRLALQTLKHDQWKQGSLPERWDGKSAERIVQILLSLEA